MMFQISPQFRVLSKRRLALLALLTVTNAAFSAAPPKKEDEDPNAPVS